MVKAYVEGIGEGEFHNYGSGKPMTLTVPKAKLKNKPLTVWLCFTTSGHSPASKIFPLKPEIQARLTPKAKAELITSMTYNIDAGEFAKLSDMEKEDFLFNEVYLNKFDFSAFQDQDLGILLDTGRYNLNKTEFDSLPTALQDEILNSPFMIGALQKRVKNNPSGRVMYESLPSEGEKNAFLCQTRFSIPAATFLSLTRPVRDLLSTDGYFDITLSTFNQLSDPGKNAVLGQNFRNSVRYFGNMAPKDKVKAFDSPMKVNRLYDPRPFYSLNGIYEYAVECDGTKLDEKSGFGPGNTGIETVPYTTLNRPLPHTVLLKVRIDNPPLGSNIEIYGAPYGSAGRYGYYEGRNTVISVT